MPRRDDLELLTARDSFSLRTVEELKPLTALVGQVPTKKGDLVDRLTRVVEDREHIRSLYAGLDDTGRRAVQEATHDPKGVLHVQRFWAKYGCSPSFGGSGRHYDNARQPTPARLVQPNVSAFGSWNCVPVAERSIEYCAPGGALAAIVMDKRARRRSVVPMLAPVPVSVKVPNVYVSFGDTDVVTAPSGAASENAKLLPTNT